MTWGTSHTYTQTQYTRPARHHESLALVADELVAREAGEALRTAVEPHDRFLQIDR